MLRISVIGESNSELRLQLDGKLIGPWVNELRSLADAALAQSKSLSLDLERVWFVDGPGAALLRELEIRHVTQLHRSQFITQQLKETAQ